MTPFYIRLAVIGLALYAQCAAALTVTPGSRCEDVCAIRDGADDDSDAATRKSDIVCEDGQYDTTEAGRRFKNCVECLKNSDHVNGSDSDLSALLCACNKPLPPSPGFTPRLLLSCPRRTS